MPVPTEFPFLPTNHGALNGSSFAMLPGSPDGFWMAYQNFRGELRWITYDKTAKFSAPKAFPVAVQARKGTPLTAVAYKIGEHKETSVVCNYISCPEHHTRSIYDLPRVQNLASKVVGDRFVIFDGIEHVMPKFILD